MSVVAIVLGGAFVIYGGLILVGAIKTDTTKDSPYDKKIMSHETRYFIGRYWAGMQAIAGGIGLVVLGYLLY